MKTKKRLQRKKQIELDTAKVITNRILDVVIMFLTIFTIIYGFNHQFLIALIMAVADLILIPINNGSQAFHYIKGKINSLKTDIHDL